MDKTYCVFGDSVTQADYVKVSWVDLLKNYLENKYKNGYVSVFDLGINGNTTSDILKRFEPEAAHRTPTSIIFAAGINDSGYLGDASKPIIGEELFKNNLKELINAAKNFSGDITFIGLTLGDDSGLKPYPDSSTGKCYDREISKKYNEILKEVVLQNNCRFIELFGSLDAGDFQDGLHPNDNGHRKMFEAIKQYF